MYRIFFSSCALAFVAFASLPLYASSPPTSTQYPADGESYRRFTVEQPPLLPLPQQLRWLGAAQELRDVRLELPTLTGRDAEQLAHLRAELVRYLQQHEVRVSDQAEYAIRFELGMPSLPDGQQQPWRAAEAYSIRIDAGAVVIRASGSKGFFYGYKTLRQLLLRREGVTTLAQCEITDWPDLEVRGLMNDVGRNYLPIELIKLELDAMAGLKFNTYHFHLTDHHAWRLESKLYPELGKAEHHTRSEGQIYTQAEFQELVRYCRLRNITVIPELDMPGHSDAFRRALKLSSMNDPRATEALVALIKELASLASVEDMPYIHIGTDEVRHAAERVSSETLLQYYEAVASTGRTPIHWSPGLCPPSFKTRAVEQLWMGCGLSHARPTKGGRYIDSQDSYINHVDPFELAAAYYFRRPAPYSYAHALGFILCSWPDLHIKDPRAHLSQSPVFPSMAFVSEAVWNNPHPPLKVDVKQDELLPYFSNLPSQQNPLLQQFRQYEDRVLAMRDRFFLDKEFPYLRQSHVPWRIIGPFPHGGDVEKVFPVEHLLKGEAAKPSYRVDGTLYHWREREATGHTVTFRQYCGYPTPFNGGKFGYNPSNLTYYALQYIYSPEAQQVPFWIGAQHWPASDRNAGGPPSTVGEWLHTKPRFYMNGTAIAAPAWQSRSARGDFPLTDENYYYRAPTMVALKKGWNQVLIKLPCHASPRRWMFTFAPVQLHEGAHGIRVREYPGLRFAPSLPSH